MDSIADTFRPEEASSQPGLQPTGLQPHILIAQLRRSMGAIAACVIAGALIAFVYAGTLPKSYTAAGAIAVDGDEMAIPELQGALRADATPDLMPLVHTEVQALSARALVAEVAARLHLDQNPEFNASLRPPGPLQRGSAWLKGLLVASSNVPAAADAGQDALVNAVMRNLVISQDNRSLVIGVAFTARNPKLAAAFVNSLISAYIAKRAERRVSANLGANSAMSQRIEQVRSDIDRIEKKMRDLRSQSEVVGLRAGTVGQQEVEDLATAASKATLERSEIEANYDRAAAVAAGGSSDALASVLGSETISRLREQEAAAASRVADLSQRYGSNYPERRSAEADLAADRAQIAGESHRIVASLATQLRVARQHEADVQAQLQQARRAGVTAQNTQAELDQLQQDAATRRDLYRTLLERAQQTETQPKGTETPDVRVLSAAAPPGLPSAPNMKMAAGMGGIGGGLLACVCILAFTRRGSGPIEAAAFARENGLHVIAILHGRAARAALLQAAAPQDAMRQARGSLGKLSRSAPRVIGFAGAQPGPLAASAAWGFARVAATDGRRVLLVQSPRPGAAARLAEVLEGATALHEAVVPDAVAGLDWLAGDRAGLLQNGVGLENMLVTAREDYDLIVLAGADPLARSSDATVLVIDEHAARMDVAQAAVARLRGLSRSPLAALVFAEK